MKNPSSDQMEIGVVSPAAISDFAVDVQSGLFKLELYQSSKSRRANGDKGPLYVATRVNVHLIRRQKEFADLTLDCPTSDIQSFNEDASVIIGKKDAQRLGVFNGSILELNPITVKSSKIELGSSSSAWSELVSTKKGKRAIAVVIDGHQSTQDDSAADEVITVKILPSLWFNVCRLETDLSAALNSTKLLQCFLSKGQRFTECGNSASFARTVSYADHVVVSCISSPSYSAGASYDFLLKTYFSQPRLLQEGDVFVVDSSVDPHFFESIPDGSDVRYPVVYFTVKKIQSSEKVSSPCFVDRYHSELLQDNSVHGFVPSLMSSFYITNTLDWNRKLLPIFSSHVISMKSIFQPFLVNGRRYSDLYPVILLSGSTGSCLISLTKLLSHELNMHHYRLNCNLLVSDVASATEAKISQYFQIVGAYGPCILVLDGIELVGKDRDGNEDSRVAAYLVSALKKLVDDSKDWPVVVIATSSAASKVSHDIQQCFLHCVDIKVLDEHERLELLRSLLSEESLSSDVSLSRIAQRSAGMVVEDFVMMLSYTRQNAYRRMKKDRSVEASLRSERDVDLSEDMVELIAEDFDSALNQMQLMHSESIGAPKIPNVTWEDVGGLANVKSDILDTIQLPLMHPELLSLGLRRSGILLYGPPGTGKTLLAKAVATECSLNFLSVKGPELLNMYVGQSEENVRQVFQRARSATPCVIFFDELDSLAPNRGRSGDSGGVMDRVVSQLLAELDGLHKSNSVFVIGATNRPDLLDPALLRPGRFDKLVYLGISEDRDSQLKILKALTRKFNLSHGFQFERIIAKCPLNLTGADFYALSADSMLNAIKRKVEALETDPSSRWNDSDTIEVQEVDFLDALNRLVPSLSEVELQRYKALEHHYTDTNKIFHG